MAAAKGSKAEAKSSSTAGPGAGSIAAVNRSANARGSSARALLFFGVGAAAVLPEVASDGAAAPLSHLRHRQVRQQRTRLIRLNGIVWGL